MQRALAITQASYGPEHPEVAIRLNNLARPYQALKRLKEAEPLMVRALTISENNLPVGHPQNVTLRQNLEGLQVQKMLAFLKAAPAVVREDVLKDMPPEVQEAIKQIIGEVDVKEEPLQVTADSREKDSPPKKTGFLSRLFGWK